MLHDYLASAIKQGRSPRFALIDILQSLQNILAQVFDDPDVRREFLAARLAALPDDDPEIDDHK